LFGFLNSLSSSGQLVKRDVNFINKEWLGRIGSHPSDLGVLIQILVYIIELLAA